MPTPEKHILEHKRELERRQKKLVAISALLSTFVLLVSSFGLFRSKVPDSASRISPDVLTQIKDSVNELSRMKAEIARLQAAFVAPTNLPADRTASILAEVSGQVSNVTFRVKALEDAISASPEKALAIPLVKKDIDLIQKSQVDERAAFKAEIERLYDFNKWFFGLIATMALSIVGLAIANAFKGSKEPRDAP